MTRGIGKRLLRRCCCCCCCLCARAHSSPRVRKSKSSWVLCRRVGRSPHSLRILCVLKVWSLGSSYRYYVVACTLTCVISKRRQMSVVRACLAFLQHKKIIGGLISHRQAHCHFIVVGAHVHRYRHVGCKSCLGLCLEPNPPPRFAALHVADRCVMGSNFI